MLESILKSAAMFVVAGIVVIAVFMLVWNLEIIAAWFMALSIIIRIMLVLGGFAVVGSAVGAYDWYRL